MTDDLAIRDLDDSTWRAAYDALMIAFGEVEPPEESARWHAVMEYGRSFGVYEGELPVAMAGAFTFTMSVPGARCAVAGVTTVGVLPTHRRRGVLTSMMRHQLDDIHERGREPVAALTAAEPAIYGRYGYGYGSFHHKVRIPRDPRALRLPEGRDVVALRFADPVEALPDCEAVYARRIDERPGMVVRDERWARMVGTNDTWNRANAQLRCVLARRGDDVVGYARYHRIPESQPGQAAGTVDVRDAFADDPVAYAELWRFLLDQDLSSAIIADRPVDDPLSYLLADARRTVPTVADGSHIRLVEVGRALATRTYRAPVDLVFDIDDTFCPWNAGRWRLSGDASGATCERTTEPAGIALGVRELGSAYLGGVSPYTMADAGDVEELRPGALDEFARAFGAARAPFLAFGF